MKKRKASRKPAQPSPDALPAIPLDMPSHTAIPALVIPEVPMEAVQLPPAVAAVHEEGIDLNERFRRACAALSQWADREENMTYILAGDSEAICTHPEVLQILHPFADQPFHIMEKLVEHLDKMVQNRSSYYQAVAKRQGR